MRLALVLVLLVACGDKTSRPLTPTLPPSGSDAPVVAPPAPTIEKWSGTVVLGVSLRDVVVTFTGTGGVWGAKLTIPGAKAEVELTDVTLTAESITFTLAKAQPQTNEQFQLARTGDTARGKLSIGGQPFPVRLVKLKPGEAPRSAFPRPQTPKPPFPYAQREVSIEAPEAGVIAGTLTIPSGTGPFPAILLISGSGQQDRDETIFGHRSFLVIADRLTRDGFVVLRTDDRGTGNTKGELGSLDTDIGDARAAFEFLRKQTEVDPKRAGMLGHSVGGYIAPVVAARTQKAAFVVSLAGPGVTGAELSALQIEAMLTMSKLPAPAIARIVKAQRSVTAAVVKGNPATIKTVLRAAMLDNADAMGQPKPADDVMDKIVESKLPELQNKWTISFFKADPMPAWRQVKVPVLALNGEKDLQVPADINLAKIAAALKGNKRVTTVKRPGLNHLYQHATTGLLDEYIEIEETFDPETLDLVSKWLADVTAKQK
ncbi:MAG: alpha/beta fold hydrolase [Kofleriaceae bacterium]